MKNLIKIFCIFCLSITSAHATADSSLTTKKPRLLSEVEADSSRLAKDRITAVIKTLQADLQKCEAAQQQILENSTMAAYDANTKLAELQQQITELQTRIAELQAQLATAQALNHAAAKDLQKSKFALFWHGINQYLTGAAIATAIIEIITLVKK